MRRMTIEKAVEWAVLVELPKVGLDVVGGWIRAGRPGGVTSPGLAAHTAGQMGASVDARTNRYGVVPDFGALDRLEPHKAALAIGDVMLGLDGIVPGGFEDWDVFEDLAGLATDAVTGPLLAEAERDARAQASSMARMTGALSALMVKRAVLGPPDGWDCGEVTATLITGANGRPLWFRMVERPAVWNGEGEVTATSMVEVDGMNSKTQRPWPDAYRKHMLTPDPLMVALGRAEWQLWRVALDVMLEDLAKYDLGDVEIMPSALPLRPWIEGMGQAVRVLPALMAQKVA